MGRKRRTGRQLWAVVAREAGCRTPSFSSRLPKLCYKACQQLLRRPHLTTTCVPNSTQTPLLRPSIASPHTRRSNLPKSGVNRLIPCHSVDVELFDCIRIRFSSITVLGFVEFQWITGILGVWGRGCLWCLWIGASSCCWRVRESLLLG